MHVNALPPEETNLSVSNYGLENIEFKEMVQIIQSLPAMTRTVFNLFVFEGFNHKEIGQQLDITISTSSWHVHQARNILQKKIKDSKQKTKTYEAK